MAARILRWISLSATALPLGATTAHVLELPNKVMLDGPLWLAIQQTLYRGWGLVAGPFEIVADWPEYRLRWESGHAISFVLALVAFCTLLRTAFVEARADALPRSGWERPAALVDEA